MKNFYLTLIISIVTVINPILCSKAEGVTYSALPLDVAFDASCTTVLSVNTEFVNNFTLPICAPFDASCTNGDKGEAAFGIEIIFEASKAENSIEVSETSETPIVLEDSKVFEITNNSEVETKSETETETEKFSIETIENEHINTKIIDKNKKPTTKKQKIGLALSGGGALGFAHIGALQALEEHGVKPDFISGSSMGAIIGAIYCAGYSPAKIMRIIQAEKLYKLDKLMSPNLNFKQKGLSSHATLRATLKELIPHDCFDSLEIPFAVCVTNITSGIYEYYYSGKGIVDYVVASASIPGVFDPVVIKNTTYVDGGVLNNLPAEILHQKGCDYIIGVDVLPFLPVEKKSILDITLWSIRLMQHSNTQNGIKYCNWLIESNAIEKYNEFEFDKYKEIYQYGYKAMTEYIHSHPEMIETITGKPLEHNHPKAVNTKDKIAGER